MSNFDTLIESIYKSLITETPQQAAQMKGQQQRPGMPMDADEATGDQASNMLKSKYVSPQGKGMATREIKNIEQRRAERLRKVASAAKTAHNQAV